MNVVCVVYAFVLIIQYLQRCHLNSSAFQLPKYFYFIQCIKIFNYFVNASLKAVDQLYYHLRTI